MFLVITIGLTVLAIACYICFVVDSRDENETTVDEAVVKVPIQNRNQRLERARDLRER